ncbi:MAG: DUF1552 domain-containing protein [Deltaproteobacteria bacterium]|nr:DUF1552 domain-containing protein [Deltaproteobacteria bacterium]
MKFVSRRQMMSRVATAAAAVPFLNMSRVYGQTAPPKRLLILFTPNGGHDGRWKPTTTGPGFALTTQLAPLAAVKNEILVLSGVGDQSVEGRTGFGDEDLGDKHTRAYIHALTGVPITADQLSSGISVDQFVANAIGKTTKLRSLVLGVAPRDAGVGSMRLSYAGPRDPVPPVFSPATAFTQVFDGVRPQPMGSAPDPSVARRKAILDYVKGDIAKVKATLSSEDRCRLDSQLGAVEQLQASVTQPAAITAGCQVPSITQNTYDHALTAAAHAKLMVAAFQCDLTRVGVIQCGRGGGGTGDFSMNFNPVMVNALDHGLGHEFDATAKAQLDKMHAWEAGYLASIITQLKSVKEGNGTLLDNTLIWWTTDLSVSYTHSCTNDVRQVLAGLSGLKKGQHLNMGGKDRSMLLTSVCQLMGVTTAQFGKPLSGPGGLAGLT